MPPGFALTARSSALTKDLPQVPHSKRERRAVLDDEGESCGSDMWLFYHILWKSVKSDVGDSIGRGVGLKFDPLSLCKPAFAGLSGICISGGTQDAIIHSVRIRCHSCSKKGIIWACVVAKFIVLSFSAFIYHLKQYTSIDRPPG